MAKEQAQELESSRARAPQTQRAQRAAEFSPLEALVRERAADYTKDGREAGPRLARSHIDMKRACYISRKLFWSWILAVATIQRSDSLHLLWPPLEYHCAACSGMFRVVRALFSNYLVSFERFASCTQIL